MQTSLSSKTAAGVAQSVEPSLHVPLVPELAPVAWIFSVRAQTQSAIKVGAVQSVAKCIFSKIRDVLLALMSLSP